MRSSTSRALLQTHQRVRRSSFNYICLMHFVFLQNFCEYSVCGCVFECLFIVSLNSMREFVCLDHKSRDEKNACSQFGWHYRSRWTINSKSTYKPLSHCTSFSVPSTKHTHRATCMTHRERYKYSSTISKLPGRNMKKYLILLRFAMTTALPLCSAVPQPQM